MATHARPIRKWLIVGAAMAGAAVGGASLAGAATTGSSSTSTTAAASTTAPSADSRPDPATLPNGPGETLLTGATAEKVKAAALAAVPESTVIRVETDSEGSPYEAHLTKSDGSQVTAKVDASFQVTATEDGFGGPHPPAGSGAGA